MDAILLPLLTLNLLATLALGFHVFSVAPGRPENRAFATFAWIMSIWIVNDIAFWGFAGPDEDGRTWAQGAFLISMALQLAFLRFAWVFPEPRPLPWKSAVLILVPTLTAAGIVVSGRVIGDVGFAGGVFHLELTPWTFIVGGWIYVLFLAARLLIPRSARIDDPIRARELRVILLASSLTGAVTTLSVVLLPLLGRYELLPFASVGILIGCAIHGYATINLRLFQPASVLDRVRLFPMTAKLSLAVAAATLATVLVVLAVSRAIVGPGTDPNDWKRAIVIGLGTASVPAMGLILLAQQLVTRPLRTITEAALEVADGRTDVRVQVGARDEVAVLATAFNEMVDRLEADIDRLRDMSEGLLRTERLATAGALAAGVAHEVNNPLAAVSSLVQTVRERTEDEKSRELLETAVEQMERVASVLQELMNFARPREEVRRGCDPNEIVRAGARLLRHDRRFRDVDLDVDLADELPAVDGDPDRLQQVVLNLILNAHDAIEGKDGGRISVRTRATDAGEVTIAVADTGRGIPEGDLEKVFEYFFTTKRPGAGTGLGLAVCRELVREHGGRIAVESAADRGTTFTVTLPAASPSSAPPASDEGTDG